MKKFKFLLFAGIISILAVYSCKNDEQVVDNKEHELQSVKEVIEIQKEFSKVYKVSQSLFDEIKKEGRGFGFRDDCPQVTLDTASSGHLSVILDFGDSCELEDSIVASGKITITLYGQRLRKPDSLVAVFDNFSVSDNTFSGTLVTINKGRDAQGRRQVNYILRNGRFTDENGNTMTMNFDRLHSWDNNGTPANFDDDILFITGHSDGVTFSGVSFTSTITTTLELPVSCGCIIKGVKEISVDGSDVYSLDFGDGTCDDTAVLTHPDGTTEEITVCDL